MNTDHYDLRSKIADAKRRLPLPELIKQLGLGEHAKKNAPCPFHPDAHPSFSVFRDQAGRWHWKCHAGCGEGDEIEFLCKARGIPKSKAMSLYLEMAGFPSTRPRKSHEYPQSRGSREFPESHESPEYLVSPVHPMSNGQGPEKDLLAAKDLKGLAAHNACTEHSIARTRRWQLLRDLRAVELRHGALDITELMLTFDEWYRLSLPFLDSQKTRDDYLALFLAEFGKVRVPTGEGETIKEALDSVARLSRSKLPLIPEMPDAPESWLGIAALHRELSRRSANGTYFLTYRDAAKAFPGLSHQAAYNITFALAQLRVVEIVRRGDARPSGGRATHFRYLLPVTEEEEGRLII